MRRRKQQEPAPELPEWDGLVRWENDGRWESLSYGKQRDLMGISSMVWQAVEPSFRPEIGVEVTMRLVEIRREVVER